MLSLLATDQPDPSDGNGFTAVALEPITSASPSNNKLMNHYPFSVNFTNHEHPELYQEWLNGKTSLQQRELITLFKWDASDGKIENSEQGFNSYLLEAFSKDISNGWSISEKVDPFKLLPLEVQNWYNELYHFNKILLMDAHRDDYRYPKINFADFIKEIYSDKDRRDDWSISMPDTSNSETSFAWAHVEWLLQDDGFESREEYIDFCHAWRQKTMRQFKEDLTGNLVDNECFKYEFIVQNNDYDGTEEDFIRNIDFEGLHEFLQNDYNGWTDDS